MYVCKMTGRAVKTDKASTSSSTNSVSSYKLDKEMIQYKHQAILVNFFITTQANVDGELRYTT